MTKNTKFYEVGGCVRDAIIGVESKDIDYAVEADSFDTMRTAIEDRGGSIFMEQPEYFTIRAKVPDLGCADFVLCRKDGGYRDGRHPDSVKVGSLHDDLSRRDFTMNAIAKDEDGNLIDPFGGIGSIEVGIIRCVGNAQSRMDEDQLRLLRAVRFSVTKQMGLDKDIQRCLNSLDLTLRLKDSVSVERIREELNKSFMFDTPRTLEVLEKFPLLRDAVFSSGAIRLQPTMKQ